MPKPRQGESDTRLPAQPHTNGFSSHRIASGEEGRGEGRAAAEDGGGGTGGGDNLEEFAHRVDQLRVRLE